MAPRERQKPFHFLHTSDGKQILIFFEKKVTISEFECRFEAEVVEGDLHHHQVIPTDPIHSPGRQKASRRYTQYLDITCLLINLKAVSRDHPHKNPTRSMGYFQLR